MSAIGRTSLAVEGLTLPCVVPSQSQIESRVEGTAVESAWNAARQGVYASYSAGESAEPCSNGGRAIRRARVCGGRHSKFRFRS